MARDRKTGDGSGAAITARTLQLGHRRGVRRVALALLRDADVAAAALRERGDAESLHQFRVALRRLRSWLRAFKSELRESVTSADRGELRDVSAATNLGRDVDVQLQWLGHVAEESTGKRRRGAEALAASLARRQRAKERRVDPRALRRFRRTRDALARKLARAPTTRGRPGLTLADAIAERLVPHADALESALARVTSVADEEPAHRARIAAKRLRYLLEPAAPHASGGTGALKTLRRLQEDLGTLHDAHVIRELLASLVTRAYRSGILSKPAGKFLVQRAGDDADVAFRRVRKRWLKGRFAKTRRKVEKVAAALAHG